MAERPRDASVFRGITSENLAGVVGEHTMNWQTNRELSAASAFAQALLHLGRDGLRYIQREIKLTSSQQKTPEEMYSYLEARYQGFAERFALNHAAVVLGALITGLEEATVDGFLSMRTVASVYNLFVSGSGLEPLKTTDDRVDVKTKELLEGAKEDPSFLFAAFNSGLLPELAQQYLVKTLIVPDGIEQLTGLQDTAPLAVKFVRDHRRSIHPITPNSAAIAAADAILNEGDPVEESVPIGHELSPEEVGELLRRMHATNVIANADRILRRPL